MLEVSAKIEDAEIVAVKALGFLAGEVERLERFMTLTGSTPSSIRKQAGERHFLRAVLDHLLADESLMFEFAQSEGLAPDAAAKARLVLDDTSDVD